MITFSPNNRNLLEIDFSTWIGLFLSVELDVNLNKSPGTYFIFTEDYNPWTLVWSW